MVIERKEYIYQLLNSRHNGLVKIITGMRRSGKSFLLFNLFRRQLETEGVDNEHIIEMAFDDFGNRQYRDPDKFYQYVKSLIKDGREYYVLLDEGQKVYWHTYEILFFRPWIAQCPAQLPTDRKDPLDGKCHLQRT